MNTRDDCGRCETLIDRLPDISPEERAALERHAATCAPCAALLEMRLALLEPDRDTLEELVPDALVGGMWPRVAGAVDRRIAAELMSRRFGRARRAFLPALAAAVVLLVFTVGFLFSEVRHLRRSEAALASTVQSQRRAIEVVMAGTGGGSAVPIAPAGRRALSAGELLEMIEELEPGDPILGAAETERLRRGWRRLALLAVLAGQAGVETEDGIQAGELAAMIRASGVSAGTRIPARLVRDATRGRGRPGLRL